MDAHHMHSVHTTFSPAVPTILIPASALLAIAFGVWLWWRVSFIKVGNGHHGLRTENGREYLLEEEQRGEDEVRRRARLLRGHIKYEDISLTEALCCVVQIVQKVADLQDAISEGANSFLITEYKYMGVFMVGLTCLTAEASPRMQICLSTPAFAGDHVRDHLRAIELSRWLQQRLGGR